MFVILADKRSHTLLTRCDFYKQIRYSHIHYTNGN